MSPVDEPPHDGSETRRARTRMVEDQLRARGISDEVVLAAMERVPRELFVPPGERHRAYRDEALPLREGQTVSQPYVVAAMTEALHPRPGDRVLEVGTGSGYQAAVLAAAGARVFGVERIPTLADGARRALDEAGIEGVTITVGDGSLGDPEHAPFHGIVVTAAAPSVPQALVDQLVDGGRLVAPVGDRSLQTLVVVERHGDETATRTLMPVRFVPLLGEEGW